MAARMPQVWDGGGKCIQSGPTPRGRDAAVAVAAYSRATSAATTRLIFANGGGKRE